MATIVAKVRGDNADFVIREVHGLDLVYCKTWTGALQFVLPKSHGLRLHVIGNTQFVVFCALGCAENYCRIAVMLLVA